MCDFSLPKRKLVYADSPIKEALSHLIFFVLLEHQEKSNKKKD
jgi:hypothetical protein